MPSRGKSKVTKGAKAQEAFAAAPTMHDALVHVEAVLSIVSPRSHTKEYLETLDQVRSALAKAEGR